MGRSEAFEVCEVSEDVQRSTEWRVLHLHEVSGRGRRVTVDDAGRRNIADGEEYGLAHRQCAEIDAYDARVAGDVGCASEGVE